MAIKIGDKLPSVTLEYFTSEGSKQVTTDNLFSGKKVVLFAIPHALTADSSRQTWLGYVEKAQEFRSKGIDEIACVAVHDAAVFPTWVSDQVNEGKVTMLADGNGDFGRAFGLAPGPVRPWMGYSVLVENEVVTILDLDPRTDSTRMMMYLEGNPKGGKG